LDDAIVPVHVPAMFTWVAADVDVGAVALPPQADTSTIAARMNAVRDIRALLLKRRIVGGERDCESSLAARQRRMMNVERQK
jgi:hypothetical protein